MANKAPNPPPLTLATFADIVFRIREVSAARPELLGARSAGRRETVSATDFLSNVHSLALALEARGFGKGDRVAIFSENRPEWPTVDLACQLVGCVSVPIPPDPLPATLGYILRNSGARLVFVSDAALRGRLAEVEGALTDPIQIVAFEPEAAMQKSATSGDALLTRWIGEQTPRRAEVPIERFRGRVQVDDHAALVYTSGTTGEPRGVMLSQGNLAANVEACARIFPLGPGDVALSHLPLSHVLQRTLDMLCLARGARIVYAADEDTALDGLAEIRPTVLAAEPTFYARAADLLRRAVDEGSPFARRTARWAVSVGERCAAERQGGFVGPVLGVQRRLGELLVGRRLRRALGGQLRLALCVGAALDTRVEALFAAVSVPIYPAYSLTEASSLVAANAPGRRLPGSLGRPLPGVEVRLAEDGEILAQGPGVMRGYWQDPKATKAAIDEQGWLRTGDLGEIDAAGYLILTGRKRRRQ